MDKPDISFIIPALNAERFLPQVLDSIIEQQSSYKKEIILIDNGSRDQTLTIARKYNLRILTSTAVTIAEVRNEGARIASAEILCFLDSDVVLPKDFCINAVRALNEECNVAFGYNSNLPSKENFIGFCINQTNFSSKVRPYSNWLLRTIILSKQNFINIGGFDAKLVTCEDVDLGYKLSKIGKLKCEASNLPKHLDDPKDLYEFFQKEYWRGQDTLIIFFKHFFRKNELLYLGMQIWFWLSLFLITISVANKSQFSFLYLPIFILPPLIITYRQKSSSIEPCQYFNLFIYNLVYYTARSLVLGKGTMRFFQYFKQ